MAKILPVFLPFASCGNKCIFCDQQAISGVKAGSDLLSLAETQIEKWLSYSTIYDEIAFYGGNFAAINKDIREKLYKLAYDLGIKKIRFSTRPDTINSETLAEIKDYQISLVELGIQSLDNEVLAANGRPYTSNQALDAVDNILKITDCGVQLMTGMYKQSLSSSIDDADAIAALDAMKSAINDDPTWFSNLEHQYTDKAGNSYSSYSVNMEDADTFVDQASAAVGQAATKLSTSDEYKQATSNADYAKNASKNGKT